MLARTTWPSSAIQGVREQESFNVDRHYRAIAPSSLAAHITSVGSEAETPLAIAPESLRP